MQGQCEIVGKDRRGQQTNILVMEDDDVDFRRPRFEAPTMISEEGRAHPPSVDRTLIRIARGEDVKGDRCRCYGELREGRGRGRGPTFTGLHIATSAAYCSLLL